MVGGDVLTEDLGLLRRTASEDVEDGLITADFQNRKMRLLLSLLVILPDLFRTLLLRMEPT
jgi:hypothetical protein